MITMLENGRCFHVTGTCRNEVSGDTKQAVRLAEASADFEGVLITRHDPLMCTVTLSPTVPYGRIQERDAPG